MCVNTMPGTTPASAAAESSSTSHTCAPNCRSQSKGAKPRPRDPSANVTVTSFSVTAAYADPTPALPPSTPSWMRPLPGSSPVSRPFASGPAPLFTSALRASIASTPLAAEARFLKLPWTVGPTPGSRHAPWGKITGVGNALSSMSSRKYDPSTHVTALAPCTPAPCSSREARSSSGHFGAAVDAVQLSSPLRYRRASPKSSSKSAARAISRGVISLSALRVISCEFARRTRQPGPSPSPVDSSSPASKPTSSLTSFAARFRPLRPTPPFGCSSALSHSRYSTVYLVPQP
mmetsp:Transcript_4961/g.20233  ORF Transcript_4961/g.20233 Transcript_4961/m.20233 type:complete len:290 (+) Transcript_4961:1774-2643(+)